MKAIQDLIFPEDRFYSNEHVWIKKDGSSWLIGISDYAQDQLGEVVYVDLPSQGQKLAADEEFGSIESIKAVNSLYMPVNGEVLEINENLEDHPENVNRDCYGKGWLIRIKADNPHEPEKLMEAGAYIKNLMKESL